MKKIILVGILIIQILPHILSAQQAKLTEKNLRKLKNFMEGEFSSELQSHDDSSYFHIVLRMKQFMKGNKDGYWLYVEQSVFNSQDKPYRQRVYHVFLQDDSTVVSKVFELKTPQKYIGSWKDSKRLEPVTPDSLIDRQGCSIFLHKNNKNESYSGSTPGKQCLSSLRGATYATSEVIISENKILSWDRGWDTADKQVWGAVKGGYVFIKNK